VGGKGRDAAHMERMRGKRAPFTDPRDGRLFSQIRICVHRFQGRATQYDHTVAILLPYGAPMVGDSELASREYCPDSPPGGNPDRSCDYPGQTAYWKPIPELMELRSPISRWRRRKEASRNA